MKFEIDASTPLKLFEGTLGVLATTIAGYKDADEFIAIIQDLADATDQGTVDIALMQFSAFVNALRGADNLIAHLGSDNDLGSTPPMTPEEDGVDFVDPTETDLATGLFDAGTQTIGDLFTLPGGPASLADLLAKVAIETALKAEAEKDAELPPGLEARLEGMFGKGNFKVVPLGSVRIGLPN